MASVPFHGFRPELIEFLKNLGDNNNRAWFEAHRHDYENLFAAFDQLLPLEQIFEEQLPELCFEQYERLAPLQQWLVDVLPA